jgi:lactate permease
VYTQDFDPVSSSLGLTAIFAALPLIALFLLLGGVRMKAQWAALIALGVAMAVALIVYGMPVGQTALSATEGAAFGLFPIMWIVVAAIWVYNMTVETGHFAVLRRSFGAISDDQRVQAVIVAFCFGALMEALAGFGTPVAITAVMLIALGFKPIKAAAIALVANTAPVAFGAIAIPITTLSEVTGLDKGDLGAMVGRQTPFLALVVPLILIGMVDGRRGIRQAWPVAVVGGIAFAVGQFACSNFISVELTDIVASLFSTACIVGFLRLWRPGEPLRAEVTGRFERPAVAGGETHDPVMEREIVRRDDTRKDPPIEVFRAYAPYLIIIAIFSIV